MPLYSAIQGNYSVLYGKLFVTLPVPAGSPELSAHTYIVTGANSGLGYEACLHLSRLSVGKLIMAVRTPSKGEEARSSILKETGRPESSVEVWTLDMDSYDSVKAFASRASQLPRLDGVLANAGIMSTHFSLSENNEKMLNVNVISTSLLYLLLLPKMRASGRQTGHACRYAIPNSALHRMAPLAELEPGKPGVVARLNDPARANMSDRYPLSKLLVIYVVRELAARERASAAAGAGACIVNTPNPSFCKSNLARESQGSRAFRVVEGVLARSTEEGSRALVHGLLSGEESNGEYLSDCKVEA